MNNNWLRYLLRFTVTAIVLFTIQLGPFRPAIVHAADKTARRTTSPLDKIKQRREVYFQKYQESLAECQQFALDNDLHDQARQIQQFAAPFDLQEQQVMLPQKVLPKFPESRSQPANECYRNTLKVRQDYARSLYILSRLALKQGFPSYAFQLIHEVAHRDSDHPIARRLLGYTRFGDEWTTPFAAQQTTRHQVWHEQFGWLPESHVSRYENGERNYKRRWMSAAKEAEIRRDFDNAWEVQTEHYLVKTNHSLEKGVEIASKLERFHDYFVQTFAAFFYSADELNKLFRDTGNRTLRKRLRNPYVVHYYRTQDEYNKRLIKKIPQIEVTNGLYLTKDRIAYFFDNPEANEDDTLYHEATHQLLFEQSPILRNVGEKAHFWIIEGIACYMESFQVVDGQVVVGNPAFLRFDNARYRYLESGFYVPLFQFSAMGMFDFQTDRATMSKYYSQASGLSHFFMHYEDGIYRDDLIKYISQIYSVRNMRAGPVQRLDDLTGVSFNELDQQYGDYIRQQQETLNSNREKSETIDTE